MGTRHDVEVLVSGRDAVRPARPWLRRLGWPAAAVLVVGLVTTLEADDEPPTQVTPPTVPPRTAQPVTVLPDEEVEPFWSVDGQGPERLVPPALASGGRAATVRVQCIGAGRLTVEADTGRSVTVQCPAGGYESASFPVFVFFLSGTGRSLSEPMTFDVDASAMTEGSQWRVWTFLPYTLA